MAVLNLRGVPELLARRLKSEAAAQGKTLVAYVVEILNKENQESKYRVEQSPSGFERIGIEERKVRAVPKGGKR